MAKQEIDETKYSKYQNTKNGLQFIIDKEEEKKFKKWLKEYQEVNKIPNDFVLTGYYLKQNIDGTNEWWGEDDIKNESIIANEVRFPD